MQDVPLSVHVPDRPENIAPGVDKYQSTILPLRSENRYVYVGDEVQAASYVVNIPYTGRQGISSRDFPGFGNGDTVPPGEPVDRAHHVGPMETFESLVANDNPGTQEIFWENRGRPEYATQYDGPPPDVPIHASLTVTKYAVNIEKGVGSETVTLTNNLADIVGKVELYDATLKASRLVGRGLHASGNLKRQFPADVKQWRLRVISDSSTSEPTDVYLLKCSEKDGCIVAAQQEISTVGKTITIDQPQGNDWKIVIRCRD